MVMRMIEIDLLTQDPLDISIQPQNQVEIDIAEHVIKEGSYISGDWVSIVNNVISVVPVVSDEFVISDEKVLGIDHVDVAKVDGLDALIEEMIPDIGIATDEIPGLVLSSFEPDSILVRNDGTMSVNGININKVYQDSDTEVVMYGGDSDI